MPGYGFFFIYNRRTCSHFGSGYFWMIQVSRCGTLSVRLDRLRRPQGAITDEIHICRWTVFFLRVFYFPVCASVFCSPRWQYRHTTVRDKGDSQAGEAKGRNATCSGWRALPDPGRRTPQFQFIQSRLYETNLAKTRPDESEHSTGANLLGVARTGRGDI